jgi:Uri superfamily endonuclease
MKSSSGAYILIIQNRINHHLLIGKRGKVYFKKGLYAYVGSAMNNQLINRVIRHVKPKHQKKIHWHIDYFLSDENTDITKIYLLPAKIKEECHIAEVVKTMASDVIYIFGSSDCNCSSHLFLLTEKCVIK